MLVALDVTRARVLPELLAVLIVDVAANRALNELLAESAVEAPDDGIEPKVAMELGKGEVEREKFPDELVSPGLLAGTLVALDITRNRELSKLFDELDV